MSNQTSVEPLPVGIQLLSQSGASLDQIRLWPLFEQVFTSCMNYAPHQFRFVEGVTPLSTWPATLSALITYYAVVFGGREIMRPYRPARLNTIFKVHNLALSILSGVLLALFIEQLVPTLMTKGIFSAICHADGGWTDKLVILYYLNYLTKYVELLDTCFLVLKKKPLTFLHTYHHGATVLLCYTQLVGQTAISWVPITLNLAVHVVMYYYYFQAACGKRVWFKQYITVMQIAQFVIDLAFIYFACYTHYAHEFGSFLPNMGSCSGRGWLAPLSGALILSSYLVLFIGFYAATYKRSVDGKARGNTIPKPVSDAKGIDPGH